MKGFDMNRVFAISRDGRVPHITWGEIDIYPYEASENIEVFKRWLDGNKNLQYYYKYRLIDSKGNILLETK